MDRANLFFIVFLAAIIAIRLFVFLFPEQKLRILGTVIHHFWIGVILVVIALLLTSFSYRWILLALGLGLVADELVYMLLGAGPVLTKYWSIYSVSGAIVNSAIVFLLRQKIVNI